MYISKMNTIGKTALILLILVPLCFGNEVSLSTIIWERIESLERRDKEQSSKIGVLEQQVRLFNEKLTISSALNEDLQKDLAAKTTNIAKQDDIIQDLKKDVDLQKLEADSNRRKIEILEREIQTLEKTDETFVQLKKNQEKLNDQQVLHTEQNATTGEPERLLNVDSRSERSPKLQKQPIANTGSDGSDLNAIETNIEIALNRIHGKVSGAFGKLQDEFKGSHVSKRFILNEEQEGPVAFHAVTDRDVVDHLGINQSIVFESVNLNLGSGYHNQHGLFVAPKSGLYIFSTSIMSYINVKSEISVAIVKNGYVLARAYAHGDSGRHDQGSVTVVTKLNVGDEISVKNKFISDGSLYGDRYASFMGMLAIEM